MEDRLRDDVFDLFAIDYQLPDGYRRDAIAAITVRARNRQALILMCSEFSMPFRANASTSHLCPDFVSKRAPSSERVWLDLLHPTKQKRRMLNSLLSTDVERAGFFVTPSIAV